VKAKSPAAPYFVWMTLFIIIPIIIVIAFAFTTVDGKFTLSNISAISQYADIFFRSILLGAVATVICLLLGYPMAMIIANASDRVQRTLILLTMLPMWMNFLLRTYAWMTLLENNGLINKFLGLFGIGPFQMINTQGAVVLGMVYNFLPFMIMPLYTVLAKLDRRIIEASQDLGCNSRKVFSKITLPLSIPGILSGVTMVFVPAVSTFVISQLLGGGKNILIGDLIDLQFFGGTYNPNLGAAMALVLMVIILICMTFMRTVDDEESGAVLV